jgi:maleate isomerase
VIRIGLIIPSSNRMVEQEMIRWFPGEAQAHVTRLRMTGRHRLSLGELLPRLREAAGALADARCDVVAFHCTANSTEGGLEGERRILAALGEATQAKVTTTATAVRAALEALGARRIVLITPYSPEVTEHEAGYLRAAGYRVVAQVAKDLPGSDAYCTAPPSVWREAALAAARRDADVYFLSCANIACMGIIEELEGELGRPVITSNQSVMWQALQEGGIEMSGGPGKLFEKSRGAPVSPA